MTESTIFLPERVNSLEDVIRAWPVLSETLLQIRNNRLQGRQRTDTRAAPSAATDVVAGDALGDVVTDATYKYTLIDVSGTLLWHRESHSTGW